MDGTNTETKMSSTTTTRTTTNGIPSHLKHLVQRHSFAEFRSLYLARSYAARCTKLHFVVQGDIDDDGENGRFWVVLPADGARLEAAGYELI